MEMFDGKKGPKIYKRKEDAEFIAERVNKNREGQTKILEIRISDREKAQRSGMSVRPDLGIAARKPEEEEQGWIVVKNSDQLEEMSGRIFEILSEHAAD